ncbi:MAG: ABC transporter permease [Phototrophicaceae bacterium]
MIQKIFTIAWKQLHTVYSDAGLLLFMLITPIALATIMGLAFGGNGGTISINNIDLAVVNLDEGAADTNYGQTISNILLSVSAPTGTANNATNTCSLLADSPVASETSTQTSLDTLFNALALSSADEARAGVDTGDYAVAIIIPTDFTASLSPEINVASMVANETAITATSIEVYSNGAAPISGVVARSVTESIVNDIVIGATTVNATITTILSDPLNIVAMTTADPSAFDDFGCAFGSQLNTLTLTRLPLDDVQAQSSFVQIMVAMGSAQAVFFAIFTMNNSLLSIYNDKRTWILQRLMMTPTPRLAIIAGKILGAILLVILQVTLLLLSMTIIASFVMGEALFIWGNHMLLLLLLTLTIGLAVSGLGVFVIGAASTPEQASIFGTLTALGMAMLGGAFGFEIEALQQFSIIYWGVDGYNKLSGGNPDIMLNLTILALVGSVLFIIGSWLFNRRIEI